MILRCTKEEFDNAKTFDRIPLTCSYKKCSKDFSVLKKSVVDTIRKKGGYVGYCNLTCQNLDEGKVHHVSCKTCNKMVYKPNKEYIKYKNHFCSSSCAAIHYNKNKKYGIRRSKLEKYIEQVLKENYAELIVLYNSKDIIGTELDIYIPHFKLAIEVNGIFHYEPIYGEEQLKKIQKNDLKKKNKCNAYGIDLHIINARTHSRVDKKTSLKYITQVINIVNSKIYK